MLFVRVAIKQRAAQLRVFHHNFDTRPAVLLLSTKSYWGRNWPIHVSTMCTNLGSFCSTCPSWYCPCFSHILRMDFVLQNLNENFDRAILKMSQIEAQFFCSIWTPPEFLRKKNFQQSIFITDLFDILCLNFSCSQTILGELLAEQMQLYIH